MSRPQYADGTQWITNYTHLTNQVLTVKQVFYTEDFDHNASDLIVYRQADGTYSSVSRLTADRHWVPYNPKWEVNQNYTDQAGFQITVMYVYPDGDAAVVFGDCSKNILLADSRKRWSVKS